MSPPRSLLRTCLLALPAVLILPVASLRADDDAWNVDADGLWSTPENWMDTIPADGIGSIAAFDAVDITAPRTVSLDSARTVGILYFGDQGPTDDPNNGNSTNGAGFGNSVTITGGWTLDNNGDAANILTLATSDDSQPTISVDNLGTYYKSYSKVQKVATISAVIAGTQGLHKVGVGALVLSGANTFSGGLNIEEGSVTLQGTQGFTGGITVAGSGTTLSFGSDANLGNNDVTLSGGAVFSRSGDTGSSTGAGHTLTLDTGGGTFKYSGYTATTLGFNLLGSGSLVISAGNSGVKLAGDNSAYTGQFEVSAGAIWFSTVASLPTSTSILIDANGGLVGSGTSANAYVTAQAWLDSGLIDTASTGALLFGGVTNSDNVDLTGYNGLYVGATGIPVNLSANTVSYSGTITPAGSTYRIGGGVIGTTFNLVNTNALTGARNAIIGIAGATNNKVTLSASNDYTGGTTINTTVTVSASNALGSGAVNLVAPSSSTSNILYMTGGVTLGNALTLNGNPNDGKTGALHSLTGANTWGGDITLNASSRIAAANTAGNSLTVSGDVNLGSQSLTLLPGGANGGGITISGDVSGTGGVTMSNTIGAGGTVTFTGSNASYSGKTTVGSGVTLNVGDGGTTGTLGTGVVAVSGTLAFNRGNAYEANNAISGTGSIVQAGSGMTHLTGANTYTGATTVNNGTLFVDGSLSASSAVTVNSGGRIGGLGSVGAVTFNAGAGLAYDVADVTQSVGLTATSFSGAGLGDFTVYLTGEAAGFDTTQNYSWTVLTSTSVESVTLSAITLDTSGFGQVFTGAFNVAKDGDSLMVNYLGGAPIPEPATCALLAGGGLLAFALWRRRHALRSA